MASPFQLFRKHQKWMIATTGLLAIFAFVFADMLTSYSGQGAQNNPEVVKTNSGTIKEFELSRMIHMQRVINTFQQQLFQQALAAGGRPTVPPMFRPDTEREVVRTQLLAEKAERLGFVVSDDFINHYIRQLSGDAVDGDQIRNIVGSMSVSDQQRVSMDMIFAGLRQTLLASKLEETYQTSMNVTPVQAWENYLRLNDRVMLEVLPVAVADFVDQVAEPSEKELQEFFEKHKSVEKLPHVVGGVQMESPDPGFRQPRRAAFQYVKAEFDKFVDLAADEVTEKEIAEYYEDNKRQFVKSELFPEDDAKATEGDQGDKQPSDTPDDKKPASEEPAGQDPAGEKPAENKDQPKSDAAEPAAKNPVESKPVETKSPEKPASPAKQTPAPAQPSKEAPKKDKPADPQSSVDRLDSQIQLVALQDETNESEAEEKPVAKDEPKSAEPALKDPKAVSKEENSEPSSEEKPAKREFDLNSDNESGVPDNILDIPELEEKEKEPNYSPLEEVSDEIRKTLASRQAAEKIEKVLRSLSGEMVAYARARDRYEAEHNGNMEGGPKPPNLIELAKQKDLADIRVLDALSIETTPLVSFYELAKLPLGDSQLVSDGQKFFASAFIGSLAEYHPTLARDFDGNGYLAWVVKKSEEAVPDLDSVRDDVVRSWKLIQARKLAQKEADGLAQTAREPNAPMAKTFASQQALADRLITTEPFSWQTLGAVPRGGQRPQLRLSEVDGVDGADIPFMEKIFALGEGQVATVSNHDKSVVYVVRLAGRDGTEEELRQRFASIPRRFAPWYQVAEQENQERVVSAVREAAEEEAGVEWLRDPDVSPES